jgi:regulator of sigma E protease
VFFHELGHFLVARLYRIKVLVFSLGFGPELLGYNDRTGTRWKLSAVPSGSYVKFFGDENAASVPDQDALTRSAEERRHAFPTQPVAARAAVVVAGPLANFILAIVIFAASCRQAVDERSRQFGAARQRRRDGGLRSRRPCAVD